MALKESLTNEIINKKFKNQFDLVNYAIKVVTDMILSGRAPRTNLKTENPALQVLEEIVTGKDKVEVVAEKTPVQFHDMEEKVEVVVEEEVVEEVETAPKE